MGITGIMSITGIIIRSPEVIIPILRITGATEVASAGGRRLLAPPRRAKLRVRSPPWSSNGIAAESTADRRRPFE
jgi:hypothetical protein